MKIVLELDEAEGEVLLSELRSSVEACAALVDALDEEPHTVETIEGMLTAQFELDVITSIRDQVQEVLDGCSH